MGEGRRTDLLAEIADRIMTIETDRPIRVAIDGITAAGKTTFADDLAEILSDRGVPVLRVTMDGFHHPRAVRHRQGRASADGYYEDAYDFDSMRRVLLDPLGENGDRRIRTAIIDLAADEPVEAVPQEVPASTVLVVDGSFLQKPAIRGSWDQVIFLRASFEAAEERGALRDADALGGFDAAVEIFRSRYHAAQRRYIAECDPETNADTVIDHENPYRPKIAR